MGRQEIRRADGRYEGRQDAAGHHRQPGPRYSQTSPAPTHERTAQASVSCPPRRDGLTQRGGRLSTSGRSDQRLLHALAAHRGHQHPRGPRCGSVRGGITPMPSESDRLLIQQIRGGDPRAWETLIARYEGRLLAFVQRRLHDRCASEDVVQETFVGFLNSLPNFDEKRELQTYLFTIASHKLTDHLRRTGRHPLKTSSDSGDVLGQQLDHHAAASSLARSDERRALESAAITRCLGVMVRQWQEKGDYLRLKVLELLWVKGWQN